MLQTPEPKAIGLDEQIKDLVAVAASLDDLAARERREYFPGLELSIAVQPVHLHSLCSCAAVITQECIDLVQPLQSNVRDLVHEKKIIGYVSTDRQLGNQDWFAEISMMLWDFAPEVLALVSAINLLFHKNDVENEDGDLSVEASTFASTFSIRSLLVNSKLHNVETNGIAEASPGCWLDRLATKNETNSEKAVGAATGVMLDVPTSLNKHFIVGRSPKSFYTGRARQMAQLKAALNDTTYPGQKIFVIYGISGSGKRNWH